MELNEICTICSTSTSRIRELDEAGPLCTTAAAAEQLGVTPSSLRIWRRSGKGPRFLRLRVGKRSAVIYTPMPIDFARRMKGALTQTLVKSLLEDAGYRVVPLGIEEVIRELATLEQQQYLDLQLPKALRTLPDFLVTDASIEKAWLVEVKYRRRWNADAIASLRDTLTEQARAWGPFFLLLFLGEHAGDIDTPANRCGIFELRVDNGNLQYRSRYQPYDWYPWNNAEWRYASKPVSIFEALDETAQDRTIQKCCDFAASYPGVLDGA